MGRGSLKKTPFLVDFFFSLGDSLEIAIPCSEDNKTRKTMEDVQRNFCSFFSIVLLSTIPTQETWLCISHSPSDLFIIIIKKKKKRQLDLKNTVWWESVDSLKDEYVCAQSVRHRIHCVNIGRRPSLPSSEQRNCYSWRRTFRHLVPGA